MGRTRKGVPCDELDAEPLAVASEIAGPATYALTLAKGSFQYMYVPTLEQLLEMEVLAICGARMTHDHVEGITAFKEKRKPQFKGK